MSTLGIVVFSVMLGWLTVCLVILQDRVAGLFVCYKQLREEVNRIQFPLD